jgi:hypothetical protein
MSSISIKDLQDTPGQALAFLRGVAIKSEIRQALEAAGYTPAEHALGWKLVLEVSGYDAPIASPGADARVRSAIAELDAWDEGGFRRIRVALERLHPEQAKVVFEGLDPSSGAMAVVGVSRLLDRLDSLEASTSEADHAAIATLSGRGIGKGERARLLELVRVAQAGTSAEPLPVSPSEQQRAETLAALHAWYVDWSETARTVIRRRDFLVMLGVAKRRRHDNQPAAPAPVVTPAPGPTIAATVPAAASHGVPATPSNGALPVTPFTASPTAPAVASA